MIVSTVGSPFAVASFHRPRLRPCLRRAILLAARSVFSSSSSASSWEERDEARWLREEQRWLREEQRWHREESRWRAEREALLADVAALRLRLRTLVAVDPVTTAPVPPSEPAARAAPPSPPPMPALMKEVEVRKEVVVFEEKKSKEKVTAGSNSKRKTLRVGSEGEEVRAMQEALEKLGFYSGEEDTEFSSFSTGTEHAVKTWQASESTSEDGVMTSELLERLFTGLNGDDVKTEEGINGAVIPAITGIAEVQQSVVKENDPSLSKHRVYLLGENRWEDPSRLPKKNKPVSSATTASAKCIPCRGEGRLVCLDCDGTGEPNIEPQFLEWVGEDMKCPYCEGLGFTVCDVCGGNKLGES